MRPRCGHGQLLLVPLLAASDLFADTQHVQAAAPGGAEPSLRLESNAYDIPDDIPVGVEVIIVEEDERPAYQAYQAGYEMQVAGDYAAALAHYKRAAALMPGQKLFAHNVVNVGYVLGELGDHAGSEAVFTELLQHSDVPLYHRALSLSNLANLWNTRASDGDQELLQAALQAAQTAVQLQPDYLPAMNNAGLLLLRLGRFGEASQMLQRLLDRDPCHVDALLSLGKAFFQLNHFEAASSSYHQILKCTAESGPNEHRALALYVIGQLHRRHSRNHLEALRWFTLAARPTLDFFEPSEAAQWARSGSASSEHDSLLMASLARGLPEAAEALAAGEAVGQAYAPALGGIFCAMRSMCLWADWEAITSTLACGFRRHLPRGESLSMGCTRLHPKEQLADLDGGQLDGAGEEEGIIDAQPKARLGQELAHPWLMPYDALLLGELAGQEVRRLAEQRYPSMSMDSAASSSAAASKAAFEGPADDPVAVAAASLALRSRQRPLAVAYWSYDFRNHPMGYLTEGIICGHGEEIQGRSPTVHATAAAFGPNDGSEVRQRIRACVHRFQDLDGVGDAAAVSALREAGPLDVLVDLMGHTTSTRLLVPMQRPAAVVLAYLGYPGTVGTRRFDYSILDKVVVPPETASLRFSEKVLYLPGSYQANNYALETPFCGAATDGLASLHRCQADVRARFGVAEELKAASGGGDDHVTVVCNHNNVEKMEPAAFTLLCNILASSPEAVLVLLLPGGDVTAAAAAENLRAEAAARGVHPSRVVFDKRVPKDDHLERLSGVCDVFVDTVVYGAHTTAADALWGGVPILTAAGFGADADAFGHMHSRVGASLLTSLAIGSIVSWSGVKSMQDTAQRLLARPESLARLRHEVLRGSLQPQSTFDTAWQTRRLERAYQVAWEVRQFVPFGQRMHIVVDPSSVSAQEERSKEDEDEPQQTCDGAGSAEVRQASRKAAAVALGKKAARAAAAAATATGESPAETVRVCAKPTGAALERLRIAFPELEGLTGTEAVCAGTNCESCETSEIHNSSESNEAEHATSFATKSARLRSSFFNERAARPLL